MTADPTDGAMDRQRKLAAIREEVGAALARRGGLAAAEKELAAALEQARAGPAYCPRPRCSRAGECRPPASGHCASDPAEAMRHELCERIRALRLAAGAG